MPIFPGDMRKKQESLDKNHSFFISGNTIKIRVSENSPPLSLAHVNDFGKDFPNVDTI